MTRYCLPFRVASAKHMTLGDWHFRDAGGAHRRVEGAIPGWDYDLELSFSRQIAIDISAVRGDCALPENAPIDVVVTAASPAARYRAPLITIESGAETALSTVLEVELPSPDLAGNLELETELVLAEEVVSDDPFVPCLIGSRLFSETVRFQLEGTASRFPVEAVDFDTALPWLRSPDAMWNLDLRSSNLEHAAMGSLQLFINSRHPDLVERATAGDPSIARLLAADVARQLITAAMGSDDFMANPDAFSSGSLGEVASNLVRACFPNTSIDAVLGLLQREPARFESMIQSAAGDLS